MSAQSPYDASRDDLLQEDGGQLQHGHGATSLLQDDGESGFSRSDASAWRAYSTSDCSLLDERHGRSSTFRGAFHPRHQPWSIPARPTGSSFNSKILASVCFAFARD